MNPTDSDVWIDLPWSFTGGDDILPPEGGTPVPQPPRQITQPLPLIPDYPRPARRPKTLSVIPEVTDSQRHQTWIDTSMYRTPNSPDPARLWEQAALFGTFVVALILSCAVGG